MNKKFSTLLAGFLLAGVVGTSAQVNSFENGKAYILSNGTNVLAVNASAPGATPTLTVVAHPGSTTTLTNLQKSLWRVNVTPGVNGANPTYTFVNVYTGTPLAIDPTAAVVATSSATVAAAAAQMGGSVSAWQNDPAYNPITPTTQFPIYSTYSNGGKDSVYVLAGQTTSLQAGEYVGVVKEAKSKLNDLTAGFKVKPYQAPGIVLNANDLNTKLGTTAAGSFKLTFTPDVQNNQWANVLATDLKAADVTAYTSNAGATSTQYVTLKDAATGKKTVYVDTAYVATENVAEADRHLRLALAEKKYAADENATGVGAWYFQMMENRARFQFTYYATSDSITILAANAFDLNKASERGSITLAADKSWKGTARKTTAWGTSAADNFVLADNNKLVKLVYLTEKTSTTDAHSEVTVGEAETATGMTPATTLRTRISLGMPQNYTPGVPADGVYIIKVKATGANAVNKDGRYYIDNLAGNTELAIKAVRQNYQDMPAAQWVVKSVGTIATITNREFKNQLETPALMYKAGDNYFYYGKDTMEFIPVTKTDDSKLGYKYLSADTLSDHVFTFNYLHELAMDKPINTKQASDSVVWVDKDGNKMTFSLERLIDDTYGYTGGLTGVANLTRSVYYIKVNDASKLQNDGRYLTYDESRKQYVVKNYAGKNITSARNYVALENIGSATSVTIDGVATTTTTSAEALAALKTEAPMPFFLKENNEVEGGACYYTLVPAELAVVKNGDYLKLVVKDEDYKPAVITAFTDADQKATSTEGAVNTTATSEYATVKVSVDNNTLALVNGVINDGSAEEVANSAFAVVMDNTPLYRRFNDATVGENADDTPNVLKFFRVNSTAKEYLYEDGHSKYSEGLGVNFLGVEGKGDAKNAAMYVDTAYVNRGTKMPQYMLVLNPTIVKADTVWCNATSTHKHATLADSLACPHTTITRGFVEGRFLINLQDSADAVTTPYANKYLWNTKYTRLGFVEGKHIGDTLFIAKAAKQDTILLNNNKHKNAVFSFRFLKNDSNDFLIESETQKNGANIKNSKLDVVSIAPQKGGWVKIQNGVPVIANYQSYSEAGLDAEVFNVEATDEAPTANDAIATAEVSIVAGNGTVTIKGAAGKNVIITNVLGQTVTNTVLSSDEATISAPAGIVVVAVEGEAAVKAIVK